MHRFCLHAKNSQIRRRGTVRRCSRRQKPDEHFDRDVVHSVDVSSVGSHDATYIHGPSVIIFLVILIARTQSNIKSVRLVWPDLGLAQEPLRKPKFPFPIEAELNELVHNDFSLSLGCIYCGPGKNPIIVAQ